MVETVTGPWAKYQKPQAPTQLGPWQKYQQVQEEALEPDVSVEMPEADDPVSRYESIMSRYKDKPITKEVILADPELMGLVRDNIRTRFKDRNLLVGAGTAIAGGAGAFGWEEMSDEDLFETWQEYHRSFAGGQTVTTANEIAYAATADDQTKVMLGLGYQLFDSMENAFVGEGTWSETFDAVGDYMQAAIWDPTTVLSLGIGKAFSFGGTKAASTALRAGAKTAFDATLKAQIKKGVAQNVAEELATKAAQKVMQEGFKAIGRKGTAKAARTLAFNEVVKSNIKAGLSKEAAEVDRKSLV